MIAPILTAGFFLVATTGVHLASLAVAALRLRRAAPATARGFTDLPPVSLVRPLCGIDNFATDTLRSTFELNYPRYEILFCVASAKDPVIPLIELLMAGQPEADARLLIGDERASNNPKLNNVLKGWRAARYDWIVLADSNVLMPPDYLKRLFASWRADTGLVASPPIGSQPQSVWAELECAFLNTYQARWQYIADACGFGFAQGKTMLWRRADLDRAGGIEVLAREVAEDAAATKVVRDAGRKVQLVDRPFPQPLGYRTAAEVWHRQVRWARLRRASFFAISFPRRCPAACCRCSRSPLWRRHSAYRSSRPSYCSVCCGMRARPSWPPPPAGTCLLVIRLSVSCATLCCRRCFSARCKATTSSGAVTKCRSSGFTRAA